MLAQYASRTILPNPKKLSGKHSLCNVSPDDHLLQSIMDIILIGFTCEGLGDGQSNAPALSNSEMVVGPGLQIILVWNDPEVESAAGVC